MSKSKDLKKKDPKDKHTVRTPSIDPSHIYECPFREFKDSDLLLPDLWGAGGGGGPPNKRESTTMSKVNSKHVTDTGAKSSLRLVKQTFPEDWVDPQTQPLPRSVRRYLNRWVKAEELALTRWDADVLIAEVEHQWENFVCNVPDGWNAKYHIFTPGTKPGGGVQHKPLLSKSGCYLVRLYYLGAWRCVFVNDQVPVDSNDAPLLPFSPVLPVPPSTKPVNPKALQVVTAKTVHLWPLLLCKALLKLVAPDVTDFDADGMDTEDDPIEQFSIFHALTGTIEVTYPRLDIDDTWAFFKKNVTNYAWDEEEVRAPSTIKAKAPKKSPLGKEVGSPGNKIKPNVTMVHLMDSKDRAPYYLPGITPGHRMILELKIVRDIPLKRPLPEPEVAPWKEIRWVEWARSHGLYASYECPTTQFIRINGLLKLSYAPHLLEINSTESITSKFRKEENETKKETKSEHKDKHDKRVRGPTLSDQALLLKQYREELRDWVLYKYTYNIIENIFILYYPYVHIFASAASNPPVRITKVPYSPNLDIHAPKYSPLYVQFDGPDPFTIKMCMNVLDPKVLANCGIIYPDLIDPAYLFLEEFTWYEDVDLNIAINFMKTRGYNAFEQSFSSGRHLCRIWLHSRTHWNIMALSEANIVLGARDVIMAEAVRECSWTHKFLLPIGHAFLSWIKINRAMLHAPIMQDREFFASYKPDLEWDPKVINYPKQLLHWMFRRALQAVLLKKLSDNEYEMVCKLLKYTFCDPDFGFTLRLVPRRLVIPEDLCNCVAEAKYNESMTEEDKEILRDKPSHATFDTNFEANSPMVLSKFSNASVCDMANEKLTCAALNEIKKKLLKEHESAILLQSHWRGYLARKTLKINVAATPEMIKILSENVFGNLEGLSALMNQFFEMFPETKPAYSLSSGLVGTNSIQKHSGTSYVNLKSKWVPFFIANFYCHREVKVHIDLKSTMEHCVFSVYDNDEGELMPSVYTTHKAYNIQPNLKGYSVIGHGTLNEPSNAKYEVQWWLTILCSLENAFHFCDNDTFCSEIPVNSATDLTFSEAFSPNRNNVLGGVRVHVYTDEVITFRAQVSSPLLEMEAILKVYSDDGIGSEIGKITGTGEIYWPYIKLLGRKTNLPSVRGYNSATNLKSSVAGEVFSARSVKTPKNNNKTSVSAKRINSSKTKITGPESKIYAIDVIVAKGWPMTLEQWERVDEEKRAFENKILQVLPQTQPQAKSPSKKGTAKDDKHQEVEVNFYQKPLPETPQTEIQCAYSPMRGATAKRDDERDKMYINTVKQWAASEPGRNARGAAIREAFCDAFKMTTALPPSVTSENSNVEEEISFKFRPQQAENSPVSSGSSHEKLVEEHEEVYYLTKPDQLKDKFKSLDFVEECTVKRPEAEDAELVLTDSDIEFGRIKRHEAIEKAELQQERLNKYNLKHMLERQKLRCLRTENLFVEAVWNAQIMAAFAAVDEANNEETLRRNLSLIKKKQATNTPTTASNARGTQTRRK